MTLHRAVIRYITGGGGSTCVVHGATDLLSASATPMRPMSTTLSSIAPAEAAAGPANASTVAAIARTILQVGEQLAHLVAVDRERFELRQHLEVAADVTVVCVVRALLLGR